MGVFRGRSVAETKASRIEGGMSFSDAFLPNRRIRLGGRPRALVALGISVGAVMAFGSATASANHVDPACTANQQQGRLCLTVSDTPDPVSYSTFDGNISYIDYRAVATNESTGSNLSHVGVTEELPAGTTVVRVTSTGGTCSVSGQTVSCDVGSLRSGQSVVVDVVVTSPATLDPNPLPSVITNAVSASFDELLSDQNGGKQDTVAYSETTTVSDTAGQTYIPAGHSGKVGTDPAASQYGSATVTNATADVLAVLEVLATDAFCVDGRVKIGRTRYICRDGGFVDVSVVNAGTGATYTSPNAPLVFQLRWDADLVSGRQTVKNFVAFYESAPGATTQVVKTRCNGAGTNLPCLRNITELADGSWSAELLRSSNGRMR
jgi:hypothetical protein